MPAMPTAVAARQSASRTQSCDNSDNSRRATLVHQPTKAGGTAPPDLIRLGRGLINTQPNADGCELDEGQIVGCQLVISGRDTPTLLDLVEEPFDQVARAVQI